MKASFFRNTPNYERLSINSAHYKGIFVECCSIATICLNDKEFSDFCSDFLKSYDYLIPFIDKAVITHGVWKCVSVVCRGTMVLVVMDHYQYPRYLALTSK